MNLPTVARSIVSTRACLDRAKESTTIKSVVVLFVAGLLVLGIGQMSFSQLVKHIYTLSDALGDGIAKQYPDKFQ